MMKKNKSGLIITAILILLSSMVIADVTITVSADKPSVEPGDSVIFTVDSSSTTGVIVHRTCDMEDMIPGEGCHEDRDLGPEDTAYCEADGFDGVFKMNVPSTQTLGTYSIRFVAADDNLDSAETSFDLTVSTGPAPTPSTLPEPPNPGIIETIGGINNLLYGIAAGIAILMITLHAVKWKTAGSPADREEAKRGIINVILGLIVIIIAAALVALLYAGPESVAASTTSASSILPHLIRV